MIVVIENRVESDELEFKEFARVRYLRVVMCLPLCVLPLFLLVRYPRIMNGPGYLSLLLVLLVRLVRLTRRRVCMLRVVII